jgi:hypothetical protein
MLPQYSDRIYDHIDAGKAFFPDLHIEIARKICRDISEPGFLRIPYIPYIPYIRRLAAPAGTYDSVSRSSQCHNQMTADEAGSAGNQNGGHIVYTGIKTRTDRSTVFFVQNAYIFARSK